jgi:large subunit ribosomal protein L31
MQKDIHPEYKVVTFTCSCGHSLQTRSTIKQDGFHVEVCAKCHPFYTGKQKIVDTSGQVDKFKKRFGKLGTAGKKDKDQAAG